jgi:hypothetical protein
MLIYGDTSGKDFGSQPSRKIFDLRTRGSRCDRLRARKFKNLTAVEQLGGV